MFDLLGVGAIVACGAMLLNGKGGDLLDFAQTALGNIVDLIGGLFNPGPAKEQSSQTTTPDQPSQSGEQPLSQDDVISSEAKIYASVSKINENGTILSQEDTEKFFENAFRTELNNGSYDLTNEEDQQKLIDNTISPLIENGTMTVNGMKTISLTNISNDISSAMEETGTEDDALFKQKVAENITDSIDRMHEKLGVAPLTDAEKMELNSIVEENFVHGSLMGDIAISVNNEISSKDWFTRDSERMTLENDESLSVGLNHHGGLKTFDGFTNPSNDMPSSIEQLTYGASNTDTKQQSEKTAARGKDDSLSR